MPVTAGTAGDTGGTALTSRELPSQGRRVHPRRGAQASRGIFITTSDFTADARAYARSAIGSRVVLVDGQTLARLMVERNLGVRVEQTFELKAIDEDYYED